MGNITITFTEVDKELKIQGTCENLNPEDVALMLKRLQYEVIYENIMKGLNENNGGYFEKYINLEDN